MLIDTLTLTNRSGDTITLNGTYEAGSRDHDFILEDYDLGGPEYQADVRQRPLHPGAYDVRPRATHRTVTLSGVVVGNTRAQAEARGRQLKNLVVGYGDPDHEVRLGFTVDGTAAELVGKVTGTPVVKAHPENPRTWQAFELTFTCADPLAYAQTDTTVSLTPDPGAETVNAGDQVWPTFTVTGPTTGTTTEVIVGSSTLSRRIRLTGLSLTAGQTLTVECEPGRETVEIDGVKQFDKLDDASRFFPVRKGSQRLYLTFVGGSGVTATATYREGWAV